MSGGLCGWNLTGYLAGLACWAAGGVGEENANNGRILQDRLVSQHVRVSIRCVGRQVDHLIIHHWYHWRFSEALLNGHIQRFLNRSRLNAVAQFVGYVLQLQHLIHYRAACCYNR